MKIAVVAHSGKSLGGGLAALRSGLAERGHVPQHWVEVSKSRKAPAALAALLEARPDLLIVWGGDGMVQRTVDTIARKPVRRGLALAVIPAGTSNLFACNLGIPQHLEEALDVALCGARARLDVGSINGERFAVMAGMGLDARMIGDASGALKDRLGRAAYVLTGAKNVTAPPGNAKIDVDGADWFRGAASSVVVGNVGTLIGGIDLFAEADPRDGLLDLAVISADGPVQWTRLATRALTHQIERSPFIKVTSGRRIDVRMDRKLAYEIDGGARRKAKRLKIRVQPHAVTVCVPQPGPSATQ